MPRVVSVDKSEQTDGTHHYVTLENDDNSKTRVEVGAAEAARFTKSLRENNGGGRKLLTETDPYAT